MTPRQAFDAVIFLAAAIIFAAVVAVWLCGCTLSETQTREQTQGTVRATGEVAGLPVNLTVNHAAQTQSTAATSSPLAEQAGTGLLGILGGAGGIGGIAVAAFAWMRKQSVEKSYCQTVAAVDELKNALPVDDYGKRVQERMMATLDKHHDESTRRRIAKLRGKA